MYLYYLVLTSEQQYFALVLVCLLLLYVHMFIFISSVYRNFIFPLHTFRKHPAATVVPSIRLTRVVTCFIRYRAIPLVSAYFGRMDGHENLTGLSLFYERNIDMNLLRNDLTSD